MTALRYSWTDEHAIRTARKAARATPMGVLSFAERTDIGYFAILVFLYEAHNAGEDEPDRVRIYMEAIYAIRTAAAKELREHGYSTHTSAPMRGYYAWWNGPGPTQDEMEDKIIEPIAVRQVIAGLPRYQQNILQAAADWGGDYGVMAETTGWSYNTISRYLVEARREARRLWCYPDKPPTRKWSQDNPRGENSARRPRDLIADRARRHRKAREAA